MQNLKTTVTLDGSYPVTNRDKTREVNWYVSVLAEGKVNEISPSKSKRINLVTRSAHSEGNLSLKK